METYTFLFTDIEGSTALLRRIGQGAYEQVLDDHHSLIRSALAAHGGREANSLGDGFFAVFSSPRACAAAVLDVQQAIEAHAWPDGAHVRVRMGIHTGEASETATGLVGLDVHSAARLAAVAYGGQVLVSETAAPLVRDSLPPGAALTDLGVHRLKDMGRPEHVFQLHAAGLRAEFPPLRSLGSAALPNNLPAQLATFIGRGRELAEVRALVESSRLVTLTGAGGCGKTRLGLQVAAELLDGSGDGVWLVELAAVTDQDAVAPAMAGALGIAGQPGRPVAETLVDALAPLDILIVLDNCEHLIGACAKTAELIVRRCPRVHLLATSREPLGIGGETVYRVPSLSLPGPGDNGSSAAESSDAVALFVDRARTQGVGLAAGRADRRAGGVGLPAAGRDAAGHRAGRRPAAHDVPGQPARPAGPALPPAHRGQPHRAGAAADAAGDGRVVLFAADRGRAVAAAAAAGVRRELRPGRRRGGVRLRRTSRSSTSPACSARSRTRAWSARSQPGEPCATGCWRPSASSPPNGSPRPARTRPPPWPPRTARTSWPSPRRRRRT